MLLFALALFSKYGMEMIGTRGGQKTGERKIMETGRGMEKGFGGEIIIIIVKKR